MTKNLIGKVALITGVSRHRGIGAAIAKAFARRGADLFITSWPEYDRNMPWASSGEEATAIVTDLRTLGVKCFSSEVDLSRPTAAAEIFKAAHAHFENIDMLVNNAAYDLQADIFTTSEKLLQDHFNVNVMSNVLLSAEFLRSFKQKSGGRIINLTSGQSLAPMPDSIPYAITKSAVEGLTISLSITAAAQGVTVNAIDPGPTDTGWMSDEMKEDFRSKSPFNRLGTPADVANLAAYLASDESEWITGQILRSRGGI